MPTKIFLWGTWLAVLLSLSGCGGPSEHEIKLALEKYNRIELQKQLDKLALSDPGVGNVALRMSLPEPKDLYIADLKTNRLNKKENGDYATTVSYTLQIGKQQEELVAEVVLSKTKEGWIVLSNNLL